MIVKSKQRGVCVYTMLGHMDKYTQPEYMNYHGSTIICIVNSLMESFAQNAPWEI